MTRRAILEALSDGPIAGPAIAEELGISRAAVWKHVETLREAGLEIESGPEGYELVAVTGYNGPAIECGLAAPFAVEYHDSIDSTNDRARELAAAGASDVAVVAGEQTGGRGRLGRAWESPAGGIWTSVLLRPTTSPANAARFTFAAAVAVARTAREAGVDARIKWPNDVVVDGDKLAGILTEMEGEAGRISWLVVGIGLNADVDPDVLPAGTTSLRAEGGDVDRRIALQGILEGLYDRRDLDVLGEWRELSTTLGRRVRISTADGTVEGEAVDVTDTGALVVETADGRETVTTGDCEHLRPA